MNDGFNKRWVTTFDMINIILTALIIFPTFGFGQVWLNQGESQVFEFRSQSTMPPEEQMYTTFQLGFAPGTFSLGEDVAVELFPNTLADVPFRFYIASLVDPSDPEYGNAAVLGGWSWSDNRSPLWPDLQCLVRVTMNAGDARLDSFTLYVTRASDFSIYQESVAVPEPTVAGILLFGAFGIATRWRRRIR